MHVTPILIAAAILFSSGASAQVNKCTVNGKVQYQQEPCPHGSTGSEVKVESTPSARAAGSLRPSENVEADKRLEQLRQNYLRARKEADEVIAKHCEGKSISSPVIGMDEADLSCIAKYRSPEKVNVTTTEAGSSKQYVFRDHNRATYIYFRNGRLSAIQGQQ